MRGLSRFEYFKITFVRSTDFKTFHPPLPEPLSLKIIALENAESIKLPDSTNAEQAQRWKIPNTLPSKPEGCFPQELRDS
jgi:hypothetical protein